MTLALLVSCAGAVLFMVRVMVAWVGEWLRSPGKALPVYGSSFRPSAQRGKLLMMRTNVPDLVRPRHSRREKWNAAPALNRR